MTMVCTSQILRRESFFQSNVRRLADVAAHTIANGYDLGGAARLVGAAAAQCAQRVAALDPYVKELIDGSQPVREFALELEFQVDLLIWEAEAAGPDLGPDLYRRLLDLDLSLQRLSCNLEEIRDSWAAGRPGTSWTCDLLSSTSQE